MSASTSFEKPMPFDDLIMTTSPGRIASISTGFRSSTPARYSIGTPSGSASASDFISGPASRMRSVRVPAIRPASAECSLAEWLPSSSMSPSTAMRRPSPETGVASSSAIAAFIEAGLAL